MDLIKRAIKDMAHSVDGLCRFFRRPDCVDYDIAGALEEVCRSNESKFENGRPVFDADGKIAKGRNYTAPDLRRFTRR